jgi:hypothetical protein
MTTNKLFKPNAQHIAAIVITMICFGVLLYGCTRRGRKPDSHEVSAIFCRNEFVQSRIESLKNSQFAGDAEVGLTGGQAFYKTITKEAEAIFPSDVTYIRIWCLDIDKGNPSHHKSIMRINGYYYFVKPENINEQ